MARQRVLVGLNYPDGKGGEKRAEPGDVVDDLPDASVKSLTAGGFIEPATERKPSKKAARTREVREAAEAATEPGEIPEILEGGEG